MTRGRGGQLRRPGSDAPEAWRPEGERGVRHGADGSAAISGRADGLSRGPPRAPYP